MVLLLEMRHQSVGVAIWSLFRLTAADDGPHRFSNARPNLDETAYGQFQIKQPRPFFQYLKVKNYLTVHKI